MPSGYAGPWLHTWFCFMGLCSNSHQIGLGGETEGGGGVRQPGEVGKSSLVI